MIQGQNLDTLFANLMEENVELKAMEEAQVMSYVMLSRAKFLDKVWVMNPFPLELFTQGPPQGAACLDAKAPR